MDDERVRHFWLCGLPGSELLEKEWENFINGTGWFSEKVQDFLAYWSFRVDDFLGGLFGIL